MAQVGNSIPLSHAEVHPSLPDFFTASSATTAAFKFSLTIFLSTAQAFLEDYKWAFVSLTESREITFFSARTSVAVERMEVPSPITTWQLGVVYPSYSPPELCPFSVVFSTACLSPATIYSCFVSSLSESLCEPEFSVAIIAAMSSFGLPYSLECFPRACVVLSPSVAFPL